MNRKNIILLASIMLFICTFALGFRLYSINRYNNGVPITRVSAEQWQKYIFNGNVEHPYYLKENLREVDFLNEYSDIFSPSLAGYEGNLSQPFLAECNITYYMEPSIFYEQAVKIKKGEICYGMGFPPLYGIKSLPTYNKGWRIVVPYTTESSTTANNSDDTTSPTYYVRTKDLMKFSKPYFEKYLWEQYRIYGPGASLDDLIRSYLFDYDYKLYNKGYYVSPDLFLKTWDVINITLLIMSILLFMVFVYGVISKKNSRKKNFLQ